MVPLPRPRRPSLVDLLLAMFFAAVVTVEAFTEAVIERPWLHVTIGASAMVAMAWRRVWPVHVALAVACAYSLLALNGGGLSVALALLIVAYTVGSETEGRTSWVGLGLMVAPYAVGLFLNEEFIPGDVAAVAVLIAGPWLAGRTLRERAAGLAEAMSRAELLEQEKEHEAKAAATRERTRLARELHDVVSHSISVITIQTQAVRRRLGAGHEAEAADLAAVETAARDAMAEMRRLFGVLRQDGEAVALDPQPGLAQLGRLVQRVRDTGMRVELTTDGDPVALPPGLDLAAYRIVQEAVTNALRHSGAGRVDVRLDYQPGSLTVTVLDDGRGIDGTQPVAGHGLGGIQERAELYGGSLTVEGGDHGGTRVSARLPVGSGR